MHAICTIKELFLTYDFTTFALVINFKIKSMKHFLNLALWALIPMSLCVTGCSDDDTYPDVDGQTPVAEMNSLHIQSAAGRTFTIEGKLTDADGISTIQLQCADLYLNKTIDLIEIYGEPQTEYDLSYNFTTEREELGESFTITVTVTDVGGRSVSQDVLVTMDGDFEAPTFTTAPADTIRLITKNGIVNPYPFKVSVSDDRSLKSITVTIEGLAEYQNIVQEIDEVPTYDYTLTINLPGDVKNYPMSVIVYDRAERSDTLKCVLSVSELTDFKKMYLADVATDEELNNDVFGVPMLIEHTGQFEYSARYYCQKAGTEIYFLPQKNSFSPICYGLDPNDNTKLSDMADAAPIVLEEANVYYLITFNISELTYTMDTYSVNEAIDPLPGKIGDILVPGNNQTTGLYIGISSSNPAEVNQFEQDPNNPHLFYLPQPMQLEAGTDMNFIITNYEPSGWWDYCSWRCDNKTEPETFRISTKSEANVNPAWIEAGRKFEPNDNWATPKVLKSGNYKFTFDAHLQRAKLVLE